ncbi:MAG: DEAD/DEAH box helicase [Maricaulaceae bacterium]
MTFEDLGLSAKLLDAIAEAGYSEPTPIQAQAIPEALKGRDVLGIAQTGTGKTASFVLPMIDRLAQGRSKARMPRTLVLEPTRELAAQVAENFEKYAKNHKLSMALLIGGVSFGDQDRLLNQGVDVLIATPGRLLDHFERGKLLLTGVQVMVVDEADRMLDMGFIPDIERIFKLTPFTRQTLFFSATMPAEIERLTNQFLQTPVRVEVSRPAQTADTVAQFIVPAPSAEARVKRAALRAAIDHADVKNGIIFCNRKRDVDIVARSLAKHGYSVAAIHGDLAQATRMQVLGQFKANELQLLVASDVAARGLDIPAVSHVFNFDVPRHPEDYVHRIGRTGRAGRSGEAYLITCPEDKKSFAKLTELIKKELPVADIPDLDAAFETPVKSTRARVDTAPRPEEAADPSERRAPGRRSRSGAQPAVRSAQKPPPPRPQRRDAPVIGLGDHVPDFLRRPTPLPGRRAETAESADPSENEPATDAAVEAA